MGFANMAYGEVLELSPHDLLDSSEAWAHSFIIIAHQCNIQ